MRLADFLPDSEIATAILTHVGMNFVAWSSDNLYAFSVLRSSSESSLALSFMRKRIASETRYMSLRVLPTESAGNFASDPAPPWRSRLYLATNKVRDKSTESFRQVRHTPNR